MSIKTLILFPLLAVGASAQSWEVGAIGGFGFSPDLSLKSAAGSAATGFKTGPVVGFFGGTDTYSHWSGEARYLYRWSDLKLSSGNQSADFAAHTHIIHFDVIGHVQPRDARVRTFVAFGAGVKSVVGTGMESASQPLGGFAALTNTRETLPVGDVGGGVKISLSPHARIRFEMRDYVSPAPSKVITAAPGVTMSGLWNDIQGLAAVSYTW